MQKWLRNCVITAWVKDISQQECLDKFQTFNIKAMCIGNIEITDNELEHFHVVVSFYNSVRFDTIKCICSSFHIEPMGSTKAVDYALKNGSFYNSYVLEPNEKNDLYCSLLNDMSFLSWSELIKKYPKLIINNYDNIFKIFKDINNI